MPLALPPSHLPLLLHLLIETPASLFFLLRPESQLPLLSSSPSSPLTSSSSSSSAASKTTKTTQITQITSKEATEARLILSNLGGLLLSVNLLAIYFLFGLKGVPEEIKREVVRGVTGALSVYHAFPVWRAWKRMGLAKQAERQEREGEKWKGKVERKVEVDKTEKTLGGPVVHFLVHLVVGGLMGAVGLGVW